MPDQSSFGRRQSDQVVIAQGQTLAEHGVTIRSHADEIEKMRVFKHEMNNFTQKLAADVDGLVQDMRTVVGLSERVGEVEMEQAKHTATCDERYGRIAEYMADSKDDRKSIRNTIWLSALAIIGLLIGICGYFLMRFGLPPMGG